ncbi:Pre-mRNA-processing protein 40C [Quillaja saponaria]|uniref:Pre-mRNA-processing protein 40C n=1 Tax=Quillaja saponaria TaxID=32244 RepID=A0AAD7LAD4_QUISA|nr:Pre-mRNA-processing protein 40C [Quillaja saponaria]
MASPAWLAQETQTPVSQGAASGQSYGEPSGGHSSMSTTPTPPTPPTGGTAILNVSSGPAIDPTQEPARAKFANAPGYVVPASSFSYSVLPNVNTSGIPQHSSSNSIIHSKSQLSPVIIQPRVPGISSSPGPLFSYSGSQSSVSFSSNQHLQSSTIRPDALAQEDNKVSSALNLPHSVPPNTPISTMPASTDPNYGPATSWMPTALSYPIPHRMPGTPGPPGLESSSVSSNLTASSASTDASAVLRQSMSTAAIASNPAGQSHPYPSVPAMAAPHQGLWLQPPQMGGLPRPLFLPYPTAFPHPLPFPARGLHPPAVSLPDSQPPGVTPVGAVGSVPVSSAASGQLWGITGLHTELVPSNMEKQEHVTEVSTQDAAAVSNHLDAWTAHKTEAGIVYYYNALTGESTYDKPSGFKAEPDKVSVQPTPVSMVNLPGTDWVLVTTTDGKKYYYNNQTKTSSWQIPSEVTEMRRKQDSDVPQEYSPPIPNANVSADRGSGLASLNAPAISTGGRDAITLRSSGVQGSSSALDLIKKKLQDSGTPVTPSPVSLPSGTTASELNGSRVAEPTAKGLQSENSKDRIKDANGDGNMSDTSSDSEDADSGPSKEECITKFKEMLKERGVAPFSKWEKELPKIVFDPRFKAIPSYSARRSLFEHYVKNRAEEERKEKRAAQKAAIEGFKQLLDQASEDINHKTDYQAFRKKWGNDPRFEALDRKEREQLLNERVLPLKKAAEEKAQAIRAAAAASFKAMLQEQGNITVNSRWSRVKDSLRNDTRYISVKHDDREFLFNEYVSELKAAEDGAEREAKAKREEQEKLRERERELRKRKEREEQEMERVRLKVRRKEAVASFHALLVETIKDPEASWTESKAKLDKDPQGRAINADLDPSDTEKLFREHIKMLYERCAHDFRTLLAEVLTLEVAAKETEDGKTVLNSWSTAKRLLKSDARYNKMPRKEREALWRRYAEETLRRKKLSHDQNEHKHLDAKSRGSVDSGKLQVGSKRSRDRR